MDSQNRKKIMLGVILFSFALLASGAMLVRVAPALAQTTISISDQIPGSNPTSTGPGGFVSNFYQFALLIGGLLAFCVIVYGGVRYMTSAGNPSGQSDAKEWIIAAITGILLLAGAYFILKVINPELLNLDLPTLTAISPQSQNGTISLNPGGSAPVFTGSSGDGTQLENSVAAAAIAAYKAMMSSANGPGGGTVSCAWALNQVLTSDGVANLDTNSVQSVENALTTGGRGTLVDPSQAKAGDIVIQAQDGHVGICLNDGCTKVISNSSSKATFTWVSNTSFTPSYSGGPGRIYKLNN